MSAKADELLVAAIAGREIAWRGAPSVSAALLGELAGLGVVGLGLGSLGLLVFIGFVALAPAVGGSEPAVDPVAVGGLVAFLIALLALGPPLVLDTLDLRNTRYAVARDGLILIEGIVFVRARLVRPPFAKLELKPDGSGTIILGEVDQTKLDASGQASGSERLFTRLRGLGSQAGDAFAALEKLQPRS